MIWGHELLVQCLWLATIVCACTMDWAKIAWSILRRRRVTYSEPVLCSWWLIYAVQQFNVHPVQWSWNLWYGKRRNSVLLNVLKVCYRYEGSGGTHTELRTGKKGQYYILAGVYRPRKVGTYVLVNYSIFSVYYERPQSIIYLILVFIRHILTLTS